MGAAEHRPPRPDQDCSGRHQHDHRLGNPRSRWTSSCALGSSGKLERLDVRTLLAAVLEFVRFQIPRTLPSVMWAVTTLVVVTGTGASNWSPPLLRRVLTRSPRPRPEDDESPHNG